MLHRESPRTHSFLWELSKSVDGDKYHNDLIYLVDKRINCCYLPQTQAGVGGRALLRSFFCAGGGLPGRGRALGKLGLINGRSVPSPGSEGVQACGGGCYPGIILPALMCPLQGPTLSHDSWWRQHLLCLQTTLIKSWRTQKQKHMRISLWMSLPFYLSPLPVSGTHVGNYSLPQVCLME